MKTKDRIVEEFILSFSKSGFEGTSMDGIAKKIGIKKGSIYTHYSGKNDIFAAACENIMKSIMDGMDEMLEKEKLTDPDKVLYKLLKSICIENTYLSTEQISFVKRVMISDFDENRDLLMNMEKQYMEYFNNKTSILFKKCLEVEIIKEQNIENVQKAYTFLLNNLFIVSEDSGNELEILWQIFWNGVRV